MSFCIRKLALVWTGWSSIRACSQWCHFSACSWKRASESCSCSKAASSRRFSILSASTVFSYLLRLLQRNPILFEIVLKYHFVCLRETRPCLGCIDQRVFHWQVLRPKAEKYLGQNPFTCSLWYVSIPSLSNCYFLSHAISMTGYATLTMCLYFRQLNLLAILFVQRMFPCAFLWFSIKVVRHAIVRLTLFSSNEELS